jgi:glycosyltransferase involved in cell wall biosynthesis
MIYGIDVETVSYPPVDKSLGDFPLVTRSDDYFVYVGRLVRFVKEVDKLIELVNHTGDNLILIGSGPDEAYLKSIAGPSCIFVGWVDGEEKKKLIARSRGLLNITKESFGIATAEALLLGVPVLGYNDGASPELINKESGVLVDQKDHESLLRAFEILKQTDRDRSVIKRCAKKLLII